MLNAVIPHIKFFSTKEVKLEKIINSKKWFIHYLILGLPVMLSTDSDSASAIKLPHVIGPFSKESLIVVLLAIFSFFLLKYRYYIHNNISLVFFIIMGIIIDLLLEKFQEEFEEKK